MASHRTPSFSNYDVEPIRSRDRRRQPPATVHQSQPVSYSTHRTSGTTVSSTVPRSERRTEGRYHNDSTYGASGRPEVRYGGSRQQGYEASRYADASVQREYGRTTESRRSRHTGPAESEAVDDTGSDLTTSTAPRQRLNSSTHRPSTHTRRPSESHRPGRVSFEDPPPSNYGLSSRGGRDGDRTDTRSSARVSGDNDRPETYGRAERRHPSFADEEPRSIRLDNDRSSDAARSAADKDRKNRGDEPRASAANKQYHSNSGHRRRASSPSRHGSADPISPVGGPREDRNRSSKAFETYEQRQGPPRASATRHGSGANTAYANIETNLRDDPRDKNAARDTEHVWQPWEVSKKGQHFRLAQSEGKIRLIQLHSSNGPYLNASNQPIDKATALQALQAMSKRLEVDASQHGSQRVPAAPEIRRPRARSPSASDSAEDTRKSHGHLERRDRDRDRRLHQSRRDDHDTGPRDGDVDRLERRLESTRISGREEPRRSMMFRRATDDDDAGPRRHPPRGQGPPRDDEDFTSGLFGARSDDAAPLRDPPRGQGPAGEDEDLMSGMYGNRSARPAPSARRHSTLAQAPDERRR